MGRKRKRRGDVRSISQDLTVRIASRFFNVVQPLRAYVAQINATLPETGLKIELERPDDAPHAAYLKLLDTVLVAWDLAPVVPPGVVEGIATWGLVSLEDILASVIHSSLRKWPRGYDAQNHNVLCNGFSVGYPGGPGSVLRNLDSRASSGAVQTLRSPPWRRLLGRLGRVVASHLLSNASLLVPATTDFAANKRTRTGSVVSKTDDRAFCSVFMQISGTFPWQSSAGNRNSSLRTASNVVLKRDLMYHCALSGDAVSRGEGPIPVQQPAVTPGARNTVPQTPQVQPITKTVPPVSRVLNEGLPRSSPLQNLSADEGSAIRLFHTVFSPARRPAIESWHPSSRQDALRKRGRQESFAPAINRSCLPRSKRHRVGSTRAALYEASGSLSSRRSVPYRMRPLLPVLQKVISRTARRSFRQVLGEQCPLPVAVTHLANGAGANCNPRALVRMFTKPKRVARFLIHSIRQMLPQFVFGSARNQELFERAVHVLVRRRMQNEIFDVDQFFSQQGLKVTSMRWLDRPGSSGNWVCNPSDLVFRKAQVRSLLTWLVRDVLLPLLYQNFYVTESEMHRNRMLFYRREVWAQLTDLTMHKMMRSDRRQFIVLTKSTLAGAMRQRDETLLRLGEGMSPHPVLAYHHIRFVPKWSGARGIQRPRVKLLRGFLGRNVRSSYKHASGRSVQQSAVLRNARYGLKKFYSNAHDILSSESQLQPKTLGVSVFSSDAIYSKFLRLKRVWRAAGRPRMYMVCMDITRSFDTVPLETLIADVLPSVLSRERYIVLRYAVVKRNISNERRTLRIASYVCQEPGEETSFLRLLREKLSSLHRGAIYVDLVQATTVYRSDLIEGLRELLSNNIVSVPRRNRKRSEAAYAVQGQGLPQGNPLSPMLTSLFYGYVEANDLCQFWDAQRLQAKTGTDIDSSSNKTPQNFEACPSLFMRQVDDTLYLSADVAQAGRFARRMVKGWDSRYGFVINGEKTRANFAAGVGGAEDMSTIPWCGYLIDTNTLEVRGDYSRYGQGVGGRLRDSLSIDFGRHPGRMFAEKAWTCFRPKLHPVLLDSQINSRPTVALNVYQASLLTALKVCSYLLHSLPYRPEYFAHITLTTLLKLSDLVRRTASSSNAIREGCRLPLSPAEVRYLSVHAFHSAVRQRLMSHSRARSSARIAAQRLEVALREAQVGLQKQRDASETTMAAAVMHCASARLWSVRL